MSLKDKLTANFDNLEKTSILFIFLGVLLSNFVSESSWIFKLVSTAGFAGLWFVYFALSKPGFNRLTLGLFVFYVFLRLFTTFDWPGDIILNLLFYPAYILFGGFLLYQAYTESVKNKNFEMLTFLAGILLLAEPAAVYFESFLDNFYSYFHFALAFVIATILYNDNLYYRYTFNEKSVIKYIFIITLVVVLNTSLQNINF